MIIQGLQDDIVLPSDTRRYLGRLHGPIHYHELAAAHDWLKEDQPGWSTFVRLITVFLRNLSTTRARLARSDPGNRSGPPARGQLGEGHIKITATAPCYNRRMNDIDDTRPDSAPWRHRLHTVIYEADTLGGQLFDVVLLISIALSVLAVALESVASVRLQYGTLLRNVEWFFTILFTIEYGLRLISVKQPLKYARSFFGFIDFIAIFPTYLALLVTGAQTLLVIRVLRLLRVFRVFKMGAYLQEAEVLRRALWTSRRKIIVFLLVVLTLVVIIGSLMYVIEGEESGFVNIPVSIYWAIVTLSTVGYGDVAPVTPLGQMLAAVVMLLGFGIIAVPTGIVSLELARPLGPVSSQACPDCGRDGHNADAVYCQFCGSIL